MYTGAVLLPPGTCSCVCCPNIVNDGCALLRGHGLPTDVQPTSIPPYGIPPYGTPAYGISSYGIPPYGISPYGIPPYGMPPYGKIPYGIPPCGIPSYSIPPAGGTPAGIPPAGIPSYVMPPFSIPPSNLLQPYPMESLPAFQHSAPTPRDYQNYRPNSGARWMPEPSAYRAGPPNRRTDAAWRPSHRDNLRRPNV